MKISMDIREAKIRFMDLDPGDVFVYSNDGIYYMKIEAEGKGFKNNAVSLSDGKLYDFEDFSMINKIKADLRIRV